MNYGINGIVQDKVDAYRGNPEALMQSFQQNQQLIDLLALQKIKSEKEMAARQMQMQMAQQQAAMGQAPTIAQQREQEVMELTKNEIVQQMGLANPAPQGMLPQGAPQGMLPQGAPQGMPPQGAPQGMPPQGAPQGMPPQGAPQGLASLPAPNMAPLQNMASGGIVAFSGGGEVEEPVDIEAVMDEMGVTDPVQRNYIRALHEIESSSGVNTRTSEDGARGPLQITPIAWEEVGEGLDYNDPHDQTIGGVRYALKSFEKADGNLPAAFAAYHGGPDEVGRLAAGGSEYTQDYRDKAMSAFQRQSSQQTEQDIEGLLASMRREPPAEEVAQGGRELPPTGQGFTDAHMLSTSGMNTDDGPGNALIDALVSGVGPVSHYYPTPQRMYNEATGKAPLTEVNSAANIGNMTREILTTPFKVAADLLHPAEGPTLADAGQVLGDFGRGIAGLPERRIPEAAPVPPTVTAATPPAPTTPPAEIQEAMRQGGIRGGIAGAVPQQAVPNRYEELRNQRNELIAAQQDPKRMARERLQAFLMGGANTSSFADTMRGSAGASQAYVNQKEEEELANLELLMGLEREDMQNATEQSRWEQEQQVAQAKEILRMQSEAAKQLGVRQQDIAKMLQEAIPNDPQYIRDMQEIEDKYTGWSANTDPTAKQAATEAAYNAAVTRALSSYQQYQDAAAFGAGASGGNPFLNPETEVSIR